MKTPYAITKAACESRINFWVSWMNISETTYSIATEQINIDLIEFDRLCRP